MAAPIFSSPFNVEKRRIAEECALDRQKTAYKCDAHYTHTPPDYSEMDLILFPEGSLKNSNNSPISQSHLKGKSVALYFADGADPKCTSFLPFLLNFYRTLNEAGSRQKIEIIFVSLDRDRASFEGHRAHMPWLSIDLEHPLTAILQRHFRVMKEYQVPAFGYGSRTGVPCVIVIGSDGREAQFLPITSSGREEGDRALLRWDWRNTQFSSERFGVRPAPRSQLQPHEQHPNQQNYTSQPQQHQQQPYQPSHGQYHYPGGDGGAYGKGGTGEEPCHRYGN